jgi:alanine racemase
MGSGWPRTAGEVAAMAGAALCGDATRPVQRVVTDTRQPMAAGDCFWALDGPRFRGWRFVPRAVAAGVRVVVVPADAPADVAPAEVTVLRVPEAVTSLQRLAAAHRKACGVPVLGVTGSNGKTLFKELLAAVLQGEGGVRLSPHSWNSQVGVALSLLQLAPGDRWAVVECGVSQRGEMARLHAMVQPDAGVWTSVGVAHLEGLGSPQGIADEKVQLFAGAAGVWTSDARAVAALTQAGVAVRSVSAAVSSAAAGVKWRGPVPAFLPGLAALALTVAEALAGVPPAEGARRLQGWEPAPLRLQILTTPQRYVVLNDSYSADPASLAAALELLAAERAEGGQIVAVLGGLAEQGEALERALARAGGQLASMGLDHLVGVGAGGGRLAKAARTAGLAGERISEAADVEQAAVVIDGLVRAQDRVLIKGMRSDGLERLAVLLAGEQGPSTMQVDLDRVVANRWSLQARAGCGVMAVVKAFGYGLDAVRLARELERAGVEAFGVAYAEEGAWLRRRGVQGMILVQNVLPGDGPALVRWGLSAVVADADMARRLSAEVAGGEVAVHLKLDTGMGRMGWQGEAWRVDWLWLQTLPGLRWEGVMSHLAASEDPAHDAFTRDQLSAFHAALAHARASGWQPRWVHVCNSAGALRWGSGGGNLVRAGIGLFGMADPGAAATTDQQPALTWEARVVSVRQVPEGSSVGYGRTWLAPAGGARLAVVSVGYNDGYPRSASNRAQVAIGGRRCPVVGQVCMDVLMADVSAVDGVEAGDPVVLFGHGEGDPTLWELARWADTIPYEILTRVGARVRRSWVATR